MKKRNLSNDVEQKSGDLEQSCFRYGFGKNTMRKLAEEAGALFKYGKCTRVNFTIMDSYIDTLTR